MQTYRGQAQRSLCTAQVCSKKRHLGLRRNQVNGRDFGRFYKQIINSWMNPETIYVRRSTFFRQIIRGFYQKPTPNLLLIYHINEASRSNLQKSDQHWRLPGMCTILQLQFSTMQRVSQSILQAVTLQTWKKPDSRAFDSHSPHGGGRQVSCRRGRRRVVSWR